VDILNVLGYCPGFSGIRVTHEKATYDCIKLLSANGHRRIAYIGLDLTQDTSALHRYYLKMVKDGMERAAAEENLSFSEAENMLYCGENYSFDYQQIRRLLLDYRPTAVLAWTEQAEAAIYAVCHEMQLNIPEDISIAGIGGNFMLDGFAPQLTHYRFDYPSVLKKIEAFIHAPPGEYNENHSVDFLFYPGNSIKNINL